MGGQKDYADYHILLSQRMATLLSLIPLEFNQARN